MGISGMYLYLLARGINQKIAKMNQRQQARLFVLKFEVFLGRGPLMRRRHIWMATKHV